MHEESDDRVIMIKVRLSKVDVGIINNWVEVSMLIKLQISLEVNFEVLEDKLNIADVGKKPEVNILVCIDFPVLDSWELNAQKGLIVVSSQLYLHIFDIQVGS